MSVKIISNFQQLINELRDLQPAPEYARLRSGGAGF